MKKLGSQRKTMNVQDMEKEILGAGDKVEDMYSSVKGNVKSLHSSATCSVTQGGTLTRFIALTKEDESQHYDVCLTVQLLVYT